MPKIVDIDETPNPNARKFLLREPLSWGIAHSYENAQQAQNDALASALFAIAHVSNVFYIDRTGYRDPEPPTLAVHPSLSLGKATLPRHH